MGNKIVIHPDDRLIDITLMGLLGGQTIRALRADLRGHPEFRKEYDHIVDCRRADASELNLHTIMNFVQDDYSVAGRRRAFIVKNGGDKSIFFLLRECLLVQQNMDTVEIFFDRRSAYAWVRQRQIDDAVAS